MSPQTNDDIDNGFQETCTKSFLINNSNNKQSFIIFLNIIVNLPCLRFIASFLSNIDNRYLFKKYLKFQKILRVHSMLI